MSVTYSQSLDHLWEEFDDDHPHLTLPQHTTSLICKAGTERGRRVREGGGRRGGEGVREGGGRRGTSSDMMSRLLRTVGSLSMTIT